MNSSATSTTTDTDTVAPVTWPIPVSMLELEAPMRWVLTGGDPRNCAGILCPPDTFCMRPEPYKLPNYCVHKRALEDVPALLAKGPAMVYCEDIGLALVAAILSLVFLVQLAHLLVYYWRASAMVQFYRQNGKKLVAESMETEMHPLMMGRTQMLDGLTNLTYEQSTGTSSAYEPTYMPFQQV